MMISKKNLPTKLFRLTCYSPSLRLRTRSTIPKMARGRLNSCGTQERTRGIQSLAVKSEPPKVATTPPPPSSPPPAAATPAPPPPPAPPVAKAKLDEEPVKLDALIKSSEDPRAAPPKPVKPERAPSAPPPQKQVNEPAPVNAPPPVAPAPTSVAPPVVTPQPPPPPQEPPRPAPAPAPPAAATPAPPSSSAASHHELFPTTIVVELVSVTGIPQSGIGLPETFCTIQIGDKGAQQDSSRYASCMTPMIQRGATLSSGLWCQDLRRRWPVFQSVKVNYRYRFNCSKRR